MKGSSSRSVEGDAPLVSVVLAPWLTSLKPEVMILHSSKIAADDRHLLESDEMFYLQLMGDSEACPPDDVGTPSAKCCVSRVFSSQW
jgi:hypothetical protein